MRAIVAGERGAATRAKLRDHCIEADEAEVSATLQCNWRDEHLFTLQQALASIDACTDRITECDGKLQHLLGAPEGPRIATGWLGNPQAWYTGQELGAL